MSRWFLANLAKTLQHSCAAAIECLCEEYRDIVCAGESERKANAWKVQELEKAAMFVVAFAAVNNDSEALALAADEFRFWAQDAASWAKELLGVF